MGQLLGKDQSISKQRQEFRYWEGDAVQGKKKKGKVIISLVEKMTRYSIFVKVKGKDNESIKQELRKILKEYEKKGGGIQEYNT